MSETKPSAKRESAPLASVTEARAAMLAGVTALPAELVTLEEALGRVLAEPVIASRDQPPFAASQMDGYALAARDAPGRLRLIGEAAAGRPYAGKIGAGQAVRISTGAALPDGADTVVMQENVKRDGDAVEIPAASAGENVRERGLDFSAGRVLLEKSRRLDGVTLALVAAAGAATVSVARRPRIAILTGGDELAEPGTTPAPFQIFDSATRGIGASVVQWGGRAQRLKLEKDDVDAIARAASDALAQCDLLVVIGGASVGDHDHARPALKKLGLELNVEKVALRPGKPAWFGRTPAGPVLGLPGNPASALVCAQLFLRPLVNAMLGAESSVSFIRARLEGALPPNGAREHYLRSRLSHHEGGLKVRAFEQQDSSLLSVFAGANALIRLPPGAPAFAAGDLVDVLLLGEP